MKVIGLTGGIASGKSTVSSVLKNLGAYIIDADVIAREVVVPGHPAWQQIVQAFGEKILLDDGNINRRKLADRVFHDEAARKKLNQITHPWIIKEVEKKIGEIGAMDRQAVIVVDAPLLIEAGMVDLVDQVWLAALPEELQVTRLTQRDHTSREEAIHRISAQMPLVEKQKYAHHIIDTSGSLADTVNQIHVLWNQLLSE